MKRPTDHVSLNIFDQIDSICREYRAFWKQGKRPKLEQWFDQVPENAQAQLFLNLLQTEIAFRQKAKETCTSEDYLKRFPQFTRQVRQAFHEQSLMSMDEHQGSPLGFGDSADQTHTMIGPSASRLGDYELLRELGRGGMGVVYEARHLQTNNRVALKTLPTGIDGQDVNADRLHRFRREFRTLSEINHPNLVGMQTLEVDGSQWFFTMDLIEGDDFLSYVRDSEGVNETRLRKVLAQLVIGIISLHQRRIIHRDIKPSNVMVDESGTVKILDFGLVAELQQSGDHTASLKSAQFAGTPRYAAPEQMFGQRSEASDWYAVGVMLYEALTGEPPFHGSHLDILRQKQSEDPPALTGRDDLPSDLAELADRMLFREPSARATMAEIAERLELNLETRASHGSTESADEEFAPSLVGDQVLVGREEQLEQLEEAKDELLRTRQPQVVMISGLSGEGKSALADKFLHPLRLGSEMLVLSGRCYDRESVPFKAIDCWTDSLVSFLRGRKLDQLAELLPDDIAMLAHIFPMLRRVPAIADRCGTSPPTVDSKQIRYRAFAALRDLLQNIGRQTPVVLFVDDLQWGDADSAEAMAGLLQPPEAPAVMFLGSYRRDEADDSPFLKAWHKAIGDRFQEIPQRVIEVQPLTPEQCLTLVAMRVGIEPGTIKEQATELFADTQGNPYFLEQLIEGYDATTCSFRAVPLNDIIATKLKRLPPNASSMLDVIAVAGKAVSLSEASQVAGYDRPAFETITHMRSERLVRLVGSGDQQLVDTYHDKIRETIEAGLCEDTRRRFHLAYGELIERSVSHLEPLDSYVRAHTNPKTLKRVGSVIRSREFDLAFHFSAANSTDKAFKYLLLAGRKALESFAFKDAIDYLRNAEQCYGDLHEDRDTFELQLMLGDALFSNGDLNQSEMCYQRAFALATNDIERAICFKGQAYANAKKGQLVEAVRLLDNALALIDTPTPRTWIGKIFLSCWQLVLINCVPSQVGFLVFRRLTNEEKHVACQIHHLYQYYGFVDILGIVYSNFRRVVLAKFSDDLATKAIAFSSYAVNYPLVGVPFFGSSALRKALAFARKSSAPQLEALVKLNAGAFLFVSGRLAEAKNELSLAKNALTLNRDFSFAMTIHWTRHIESLLGCADHIVAWSHEELAYANDTGDVLVGSWAKYGLADGFSRRGDVEKALSSAKQSVKALAATKHISFVIALQELGRAQLMGSDYQSALKTLEQATKAIVRKWCFVEIVLDCVPLLVEAILAEKWFVPTLDSRQLAVKVSWMRLMSWQFPTLRPHLNRVSGRAATARGKRRKALKYFDKAIASAQKIGAEYELARSMIDKSMLDHPQATADRQRGLDLLESLGCVLPDAEVEYLGLDRAAHHARAADARARYQAELEAGK